MASNPQTSSSNAGRRGRPCLPEGERRTHPVKAYFDTANYRKLLRRSKRTGTPLSTLVYELAINGYVREPLTKEVVATLRDLSGMANNLNQLTRLGHIHGAGYIEAEGKRLAAEIDKVLIKINELL